MGTNVPQVGTVAARVGEHHSAHVRGGGQAPTWQVDTGRGQVRGGGRTHRTDANLRVGKRDHVVGGVHFQTPFSHCSRVCARSLCVCVCVCFCSPARPRNSHCLRFVCALCSEVVVCSLVFLASVFLVALDLQLCVTLRQCSEFYEA